MFHVKHEIQFSPKYFIMFHVKHDKLDSTIKILYTIQEKGGDNRGKNNKL